MQFLLRKRCVGPERRAAFVRCNRVGIRESVMNAVPSNRDLAGRRAGSSRAVYILAVSGVLGVVTFTLVYLSTMSFIAG
jgi:hypothetical protein